MRARPSRPGRHIRRRGLDFHARATRCWRRAACSTPRRAVAGRLRQPRRRCRSSARPLVAILATGDELVPPGERARAGPDRRLQRLWRRGDRRRPAARPCSTSASRRDDRDRDRRAAGAGAKPPGADVVVTLGGASVGDHDFVHDVLDGRGHGARLLEDRHAARQAADVRPQGQRRAISACPAIRWRASSARTCS